MITNFKSESCIDYSVLRLGRYISHYLIHILYEIKLGLYLLLNDHVRRRSP